MLIGFEGASVQILWWPAYSPPADPCESGCKSGTKLCERSQVVITAHDSTCSRWSCHFDPKIKFCEKDHWTKVPKNTKSGNGFVLVHTKKKIEKGQAKKDRNCYFVLDQTPEYDEPKLLCYTELSLFLFRLHEFKGCPTGHHEGDICSVERKFSAPTLSQHWSRSLMGSHTSKVCCWRNRGSSTTKSNLLLYNVSLQLWRVTMPCTGKKFENIFWLALLATTPFIFQFLPLRRSAPHRPGTVKLFGIQLQDVAVNTNLVRSESAFGTLVVQVGGAKSIHAW